MVDFLEQTDGSVALRDLAIMDEIDGPNQKIIYYKSDKFGRILVINDELQHVEAWSFVYHEMIIHLPASFIANLESVLILGGGDLHAAHEALKYPSVKRVDLVDHDKSVIEASLRCYPELQDTAADPRFHIHEADAFEWLEKNELRYDLIVNDCCDLVDIRHTISPDIYIIISKRLTEKGICSDLVYRHVMDIDKNRSAISYCREFGNLSLSLLAIPEYPGTLHILTMWGSSKDIGTLKHASINSEHTLMANSKKFLYFDPNQLDFYLHIPPGFASKII
jgi:spermidine synthase